MSRNFVRKCHLCNEPLFEDEIEELGNARGYGYYIKCKNCGNENVISEVDLYEEL